MNLESHKFYSDDELLYLNEVYDKSESLIYRRHHNLFFVEETNLGPSRFVHVEKLEDSYKKKVKHQYFLKYSKNSFAKIHSDNNSGLTQVTLCETSEDVIGGQIITELPYRSNNFSGIVRPDDKDIIGRDCVPRIVNLNDGETITYGSNVLHGVTQIEQGIRKVFIVWFEKDR